MQGSKRRNEVDSVTCRKTVLITRWQHQAPFVDDLRLIAMTYSNRPIPLVTLSICANKDHSLASLQSIYTKAFAEHQQHQQCFHFSIYKAVHQQLVAGCLLHALNPIEAKYYVPYDWRLEKPFLFLIQLACLGRFMTLRLHRLALRGRPVQVQPVQSCLLTDAVLFVSHCTAFHNGTANGCTNHKRKV